MTPARYDIAIRHGAPFGFRFQLLDDADQVVDLTGYTIVLQFRRDYATEEIVFEMSDANGRIVAEDDSWISVSGTKDDSKALPVLRPGMSVVTKYVYDLKLSKDDDVLFPLEGVGLVSPEVTR